MSTQRPDPYGIDGSESGSPQGEYDKRARSTRLDEIPVEPGRTCVECGYDLTGLFVGGNCPECGDRILSVSPRAVTGDFKRMPNWYLRMLSVVLGAMVVVFLVVVFLVLDSIHNLITGAGPSVITAILLGLFAVSPYVWLACVIVICIPPPEREPARGIGRSLPELALAALAVLSQSGIIVLLVYSIFLSVTNSAPPMNLAKVSWMVSALGVSIVALQVAKIAYRFDDDDRARMLQYAAVAMVIGDVTFALLPQPLSLLLLGWGYLYFVWSLWILSREAGWAVRNANAVAARIGRLKQRARENYEQAQAEREAKAPFGGPLP